MAEIMMPQLGETVTEGTITKWFKQVGDTVAMDEILYEVSTDKVDSEVPSTMAGVLSEIRVQEGETVDVGTVLAVIGAAAGAPAPAAPASAAIQSEPQPAELAVPELVGATEGAGRLGADGRLLSPIVRRLAHDHNLDLGQVTGSGLGGRITRNDVQRAIEAGGSAPAGPSDPPALDAPAGVAADRAPAAPSSLGPSVPGLGQVAVVVPSAVASASSAGPVRLSGRGDQRVPLNRIRKLTGDHMVMSQATSAHTLTVMEVDFEGVDRVRRALRDQWKAAEGFSLTYLPFISRATSDAIAAFPLMNATVGEGEMIVHGDVNLGVAVDLGFEGLVAPVVRQADSKRLRAIAREIHDLATRARSRQLRPDDISGGTFTLTNPGQYGTMLQFPIINQPQVAILSTDGVRRKPWVVTDEHGAESIAIRPIGLLGLAWDHRAFDGAYAAAFLDRLRQILETRDWTMEVA